MNYSSKGVTALLVRSTQTNGRCVLKCLNCAELDEVRLNMT